MAVLDDLRVLIEEKTGKNADRTQLKEGYKAILESGCTAEELDQALRTLGAEEAGVDNPDFPGYPVSLDNPIWDNKTHDLHQAAAEISRPLREKEFLENRWTPPLEGSFAAITIPDPDNPEASRIFITERDPSVGEGKGFLGGLLEADELQKKERRPYREMAEELAEISGRSQADIEAILKPLIPYLQPLASYDDPTHYLNTGSNKVWSACSHVHTLSPPPETDRKAKAAYQELQDILQLSVEKTVTAQASEDQVETKGASIIPVSDLAGVLDQFAYPHEALGAMIAAQVEIQKLHPEFDLVEQIKQTNPESLQRLADNMHEQVGQNATDVVNHVKLVARQAKENTPPTAVDKIESGSQVNGKAKEITLPER